MKLDPESAKHLGWEQLRQQLSDRAHTPLGKAACASLTPFTEEQSIRGAQDRLRQLTWLADQGESPPIGPVEVVEPDLLRAEKGGVLDAEGVLAIAEAMRVSSQVRAFLMRRGDQAGRESGGDGGPVLVDLARGSHDLGALGRDLGMAFDPDGRLRDSASPQLQQLRRRATQQAEAIRSRLERMMRSGPLAAALGEPYITQRGERYVLPIRSDSRGEVEGIVHDTSQSGATFFIEPSAIIAEGNKLKIAQAAVLEEERRILAEYSREIAEAAGALRDNLRMLAKADQIWAAVQLGQALHGTLVEVSGRGFDLRQARHPLMVLARDRVVANDIRLSEERRALLVTGPNAGGKTVVLKTLGLSVLMAQSGLPIPAAEGTRLGLFTSLAAIIGDSQDIAAGWSTFSAHVDRIRRVLESAGEGSLVLIDELAADTDPRHGAALAAAILEALADCGARALVTTHFEELKQLPYQDERFANASVGFDLNTMEPTFQLHPDLPGRSLTLDMARRLGLAETLIARAAARLAGEEVQLEQMLESLEAERQSLEALRQRLDQERQQAEADAASHREAAQRLEARRQDLLGEGRAQLLAEIATARRRVAAIIESLRAGGQAGMRDAVDASHQLITLADRLEGSPTGADAPGPGGLPARTAPAPDGLRPGDRVRLLHLDREGEVDSLDRAGAMVTVRLGAVRTRVPVEQVQLVHRPPAAASQKQARKKQPSRLAEAKPTEIRTPTNTLDLRGLRADEAADRTDKFLDELFGMSESAAFIIHGHGTGALKAAVRDYLSSSPYQRHFRSGTPDEGGDGVTVVALK